MTRDDILRMAREAGFRTGSYALSNGDECVFAHPVAFSDCIPELERFANLIAAEVGIAQYQRGYAEGQAFEREQCAAIADAERAAEFRRPVSAHQAGQYEMAEYIYEAIVARNSNDQA